MTSKFVPVGGTIRLRWVRTIGKWGGDRRADQETLLSVAGKHYFTDAEYDQVLAAVSRYGYDLETPLEGPGARPMNPRKNALPRRRQFVQKTARAFFERIERNFAAYKAGRIATAEFNRRQREIWDEIESKSPEVYMEVERLLRVPWSPGRNGAPQRNPAYPIIEMDRDTGEPTGRKEFYAAHNQYEAAKYALATRLLKEPGWKIGPTGLVVYRPRDNKVWVVDVGRKQLANPRKNALPHHRRFVEKTAANFFRLLQKNADDVTASRVTWVQFHRRQRELWTAIAARPDVNEEVSRMLRESLRAGRPGPNPRHRPAAWRRIFRDAREAADWIDRQPSGHVVKAVWFSNSTWQVVIGDYGDLPSPKGQWVEMSLAELRRFAGRANPRKAAGPKPRATARPSRWPSWMRDEKAFRAKFGVSTQKFRDMLAFLSASRRAEFQRDVDRGFPELAIRAVVKFLKGNRGRR